MHLVANSKLDSIRIGGSISWNGLKSGFGFSKTRTHPLSLLSNCLMKIPTYLPKSWAWPATLEMKTGRSISILHLKDNRKSGENRNSKSSRINQNQSKEKPDDWGGIEDDKALVVNRVVKYFVLNKKKHFSFNFLIFFILFQQLTFQSNISTILLNCCQLDHYLQIFQHNELACEDISNQPFYQEV